MRESHDSPGAMLSLEPDGISAARADPMVMLRAV